MDLHFTTIGGADGRASPFYVNADLASRHADKQNARAERLGIKARYTVEITTDAGVNPQEIRDALASAA